MAEGTLDDLFKAAKLNDVAEVQQFLDRGMDPGSTNKEGYTLLMYAAREGHIELVRLLLDRRANVNARNPSNETAVMFAAYMGHASTMKLLHSRGAQLNKDGWTPLHYGAYQGYGTSSKTARRSRRRRRTAPRR
jgi:ankyrin repeat protein